MFKIRFEVLDSFAGYHPETNKAVSFRKGAIITGDDWPIEKLRRMNVRQLPFYHDWTIQNVAAVIGIVGGIGGLIVLFCG